MKVIFETADFKKANKTDMTVLSSLILTLAQREEVEEPLTLPQPEETAETAASETEKPKRHRRTRAEMRAARAAEKEKKTQEEAKSENVAPVEPVKEEETKEAEKPVPETHVAEIKDEKVVPAEPKKEEVKDEKVVPAEPVKEETPKEDKPSTVDDTQPVEITREGLIDYGKSLVKKGLSHNIGKLMLTKYKVSRFSQLPNDKLADVYLDLKNLEKGEE